MQALLKPFRAALWVQAAQEHLSVIPVWQMLGHAALLTPLWHIPIPVVLALSAEVRTIGLSVFINNIDVS